jgi:hypothetical protein
MPPAIFAMVIIFEVGSYCYGEAILDHSLPIYVSLIAGMTGTCCHTQLLMVKIGVS